MKLFQRKTMSMLGILFLGVIFFHVNAQGQVQISGDTSYYISPPDEPCIHWYLVTYVDGRLWNEQYLYSTGDCSGTNGGDGYSNNRYVNQYFNDQDCSRLYGLGSWSVPVPAPSGQTPPPVSASVTGELTKNPGASWDTEMIVNHNSISSFWESTFNQVLSPSFLSIDDDRCIASGNLTAGNTHGSVTTRWRGTVYIKLPSIPSLGIELTIEFFSVDQRTTSSFPAVCFI